MRVSLNILIVLKLCLIFTFTEVGGEYYGFDLGTWKDPIHHDLGGNLYAISKDEILIKGFNYDGLGPKAWFRIAKKDDPEVTDTPDNKGVRVPFPTGFGLTAENSPILKEFKKKDIIVKLPYNLADIRWFQVYCEQAAASFGHILIPSDFEAPETKKLKPFTQNAHGLKSGVVQVIDHRTIYIPDLHYDGKGPDAFFIVGPVDGSKQPNKKGVKIPDETGKIKKLKAYNGQSITLTLPEELSIEKIKWISMYCIAADQNFGDVTIPRYRAVLPKIERKQSSENCLDIIQDRLQLEWELIGTKIYFKLWAAIEDTQWAGIGFKKADDESKMIPSDAIITYQLPNHERQFHAEDYYLSAYEQCTKKAGVCPDLVFESDAGTDNVDVEQSESNRIDGVTLITFSRPLAATDPVKDIGLNQTIKLFGAFGDRNIKSMDIGLSYEQILAHKGMDRLDKTSFITVDFRQNKVHTCEATLRAARAAAGKNKGGKGNKTPFPKTCFTGVKEFQFVIGPTGGDRGYKAITGQTSWGYSMWVNGRLAPELCLLRGEKYTFKIHGGTDSRGNGMNYHPLYITDDPVGGYRQKNKDERNKVNVYAGVDFTNPEKPEPTWIGQYCEWTSKDPDDDRTEKAKDFCEFKKSLERRCDPIDAKKNKIIWTVPNTLPDTVYYQCFTHNYFGWKIHVLDKGQPCPCSSDAFSVFPHPFTSLAALAILAIYKTIVTGH